MMKKKIIEYIERLKWDKKFKTIFIAAVFLIFLIFSIKTVIYYKKQYELFSGKLKSLSLQEGIMKKKITLLKKSMVKEKELEEKYKKKFLSRVFYSIPEVKIHIQNSLDNFNLSLLNIYRIEKDNITSTLKYETPVHKVNIPYELVGTFDNLYNFLLFYNAYERYVLFNQYPFFIKFYSENLISIKFYASAIIVYNVE